MRPDAGLDPFRLVAALVILRRARGASRAIAYGCTPAAQVHERAWRESTTTPWIPTAARLQNRAAQSWGHFHVSSIM